MLKNYCSIVLIKHPFELKGAKMKEDYIETIKRLLNECEDLELLDFIFQLLHKASLQETAQVG